MKAVILAAGLGKRMGMQEPKPLLRVFGLPIVEHTLLRLKGFEVAVVYSDERVAQFLRERYPDVNLIYNPSPDRENGFSLSCAGRFVKRGESFLLLMADHIYSPEFFEKLETSEVTKVFVSKFCHKPYEATKVRVEGGKVISIGKGIEEFSYFDTGFFTCTYDVIDVAESLALKRERFTVSDVMQVLSEAGKLSFEEVNGFWVDVDTPEDLKFAEEKIRESLIKPTDGPVSKLLNRKFSTRISPFLIRFDFLTPNAVSLVIATLGVFASILFLLGKGALGGILTQFVSILDGCDGEIAKVKSIKSRFGALLDSLLDRYVDGLIVCAISLSLGGGLLVYTATFLALSGVILVSYASHLGGFRPYFITRDVRMLIFMLGGLLSAISGSALHLTLWFVGILSHAGVLYVLLMSGLEHLNE